MSISHTTATTGEECAHSIVSVRQHDDLRHSTETSHEPAADAGGGGGRGDGAGGAVE